MSFLVQYRRLFSIRVKHDHYLSPSEDQSFFGLDEDNDQTIIASQLENYDIQSDLILEPTAETLKFMKGNKMLFRREKSGWQVSLSVQGEVDTDGAMVYAPLISKVQEPFRLVFKLKVKNPVFFNFTGINIKAPTSALYYFSNSPETGKAFPSLSLTPPAYLSSNPRSYEMGELVSLGGDIYEALESTNADPSDTTAWKQILNDYRLVNQSDHRLLLSKKKYHFDLGIADYILIRPVSFIYYLPDGVSASDVNFVLEKNGQEYTPIEQSVLSNSGVKLLFHLEEFGAHTLQVGGSVSENIPIYVLNVNEADFSNSSGESLLGYVEIFNDNNTGDFGLFDQAGNLKTSGDGADKVLDPPAFEIRFKARATYWEYKLHPQDTTALTNLVDVEISSITDRAVVTTEAKPLIRKRVDVDFNSNIEKLPNPNPDFIHPRADGRVYSEIYLPLLS